MKNETIDAPEFVFRIRNLYHSPSGETITQRIIVCGEPPDDFDHFLVNVTAEVENPFGKNPTGSKVIAIPATTVEDAFAMLPPLVEKTQAEIRAQGKSALTKKLLTSKSPVPPDFNRDGAARRSIGLSE